jgi:quinoprotein glucose dehydrogenase
VHHDLWDYDVPAQPVLATVKGQPALIQPTKTGQIFVLNRETGVPIFPVEERPVPQSTVLGEKTSPTQPFSSLPALVPHAALKASDAWGIAYFDRKGCETELTKYKSEGIFTPPSLEGTLVYPGIAGGSNWGSVAFDTERQLVIANTSRIVFAIGLVPREKFEESRKLHPKAEWAPMTGTPYVMWRQPMLSSLGIPCIAPPWGTLTALDLKTGKIAWQVPFGTTRDLAPVPVSVNLGTPSIGGPIVTASGLAFIGAAMDNYIRAFDTVSGKELWKERLPAGGQATPMTYSIGGKQYVVIAAGGHSKFGSKLGDAVIAYTLP